MPRMREMMRLNARTDRPGLGMTFRHLRSFAGLAAAIVPCAIVVHLVAEAAATGDAGLSVGFVVRHGYFGALFLAAAWWFGTTAGLGRPAAERRRRCALLRADLNAARPQSLVLLVGANVTFFTLTQAVEGLPIASGAIGLGLGVALAGSVLSALLVFVFGQSIVAAGLDTVIGTAPFRRAAAATFSRRERKRAAGRHARAAYSLFVPNRPPPTASRI